MEYHCSACGENHDSDHRHGHRLPNGESVCAECMHEPVYAWHHTGGIVDSTITFDPDVLDGEATAELLNEQIEDIRTLRTNLTSSESALSEARELARALAVAVHDYRLVHDSMGDEHLESGRAWDRMRRAEIAITEPKS